MLVDGYTNMEKLREPPGAWLLRAKCVKDVGLFNEKLGHPTVIWDKQSTLLELERRGGS